MNIFKYLLAAYIEFFYLLFSHIVEPRSKPDDDDKCVVLTYRLKSTMMNYRN